MTNLYRRVPAGLIMVMAVFIAVAMTAAAQHMPRTTTERIAGTPAVATETLKGTVVLVDGNNLVVRMSSGEIRYFQPPETREFIVDGKAVTLRDLKVGTTLTATVTKTTTPVTERTTTIGTGTVWFVSGPNVIITLPNGENRQYKVTKDYKFNVGGQPATVFELRKGMKISAQKIVESPKTELATNIAVTGHAPPAPKPKAVEVAHAPRPTPPPEEPVRTEAAAPEPAPVHHAAAHPVKEKELPPTASEFPLIGLLGLVVTVTALTLRKLRRG